MILADLFNNHKQNEKENNGVEKKRTNNIIFTTAFDEKLG